jgi:iron complex outermembrane receptor protein
MNYRLSSAVAAILAANPAQGVLAQAADTSAGKLEEIIVTAQRRTESLQDVPLSIQALTGESLKEMKASTIDEFVRFLPSVTTANLGPSQNNIYMRGLNVGTVGVQGQGTVGQWPNVAVYLDEQSTQMPGRNLDVYAADLERIEVLTGPQGTLFGAGAQAGVLRYITNKPDLSRTTFTATGGYSTTAHGEDSASIEGTLNLPLIEDKLGLRVVVYNDSRGGYIDNVASTFTRRGTDLGFALRTDGVVPADSEVIDNFAIARDDINSVDYKGLRASLKWQITDEWDALLTQSYQEMDAQGVFYQFPVGSEGQDLDPLEATLFNDDHTDDRFSNTALTVTGTVGPLGLVYAGAYLSRHNEQISDYTNYARGVWGTYYQCTGISGDSVDKCYTPSSTWFDWSENRNLSQEIRLTSPTDWRLRFVGGLFYEKRELDARANWRYKSVPECPDTGLSEGSCFLYLDPRAAPKFESATLNDPHRRDSRVGFFNDSQREYTQFATFVSADFDVTESITLTLGTRYYDIENEMLGANMGSFYCKVYGTGETGPCTGALYDYGDVLAPYGTNLDEQADNPNQSDGFRSRANVSWDVNDDVMLYATWSEGYRPGGFNRGTTCGLRDVDDPTQFQWCTPTSYDSDDLTNYEVGWKTTLFGGTLQFNGAIYREIWKDVQTGIFAPQLGLPNLNVSVNGPEYEVNGIEISFVAAPMDGLLIQGAGSYNESELTNSPQLVSNAPGSPTLGENITEACLVVTNGVCTQTVSVVDVFGPQGQELANAPKLQWNLRARYEWVMAQYRPFVSAAVQYQDESFSSATVVNRHRMPAWTTMDASIGVNKDEWNVELYVINLTDENKSLYTSTSQFILAEVPQRPRTIGLRIGYSFGGQ